MARLLAEPATTREDFVSAFLVPPLLDSAGMGHFGTLYTAAFYPLERGVEYRWPGLTWHRSIDAFEPGEHAELVEAGPGSGEPR